MLAMEINLNSIALILSNWNLCQCELNLIKFICYCVLSPCLLKAYSTIESLSIYIILKNPQRRGIRTLAYCV